MILAAAYLCLCASMRLTVRDTSFSHEECMLYYIVNADGMKGLGHSILLLVDKEGCGTVFSFNGMQRSLGECLMGKSGIGKFSTGVMTAEEYQTVLEQASPYMAAEKAFSALYEKWAVEEDVVKKAEYQQALERMGEDESLPLYHIYSNNCDHAARKIAAAVDPDLQEYTEHAWRMTPNGNLKAFAGKAEKWGVMTLGKQILPERILLFLMVF